MIHKRSVARLRRKPTPKPKFLGALRSATSDARVKPRHNGGAMAALETPKEVLYEDTPWGIPHYRVTWWKQPNRKGPKLKAGEVYWIEGKYLRAAHEPKCHASIWFCYMISPSDDHRDYQEHRILWNMNHPKRLCIVCTTNITHRRSDARTCSTKCRVKAHRDPETYPEKKALTPFDPVSFFLDP